MELEIEKKLYKSHGVFWMGVVRGDEPSHLVAAPLCATDTCRAELEIRADGYYCSICEKLYSRKKNHAETKKEAEKRWRGAKTFGWEVVALDLPPTHVKGVAEDDTYWIEAKIGQKNGKKMAVVYFGEKTRAREQTKKDYSQIFLDIDDEQLRFDKTNKNPTEIISVLTANFDSSSTTLEKNRDNKTAQ